MFKSVTGCIKCPFCAHLYIGLVCVSVKYHLGNFNELIVADSQQLLQNVSVHGLSSAVMTNSTDTQE